MKSQCKDVLEMDNDCNSIEPTCNCAIAELIYWEACKHNLASDTLGWGGAIGDAADVIFIRTVVDPRIKSLQGKIKDHGIGCQAQAGSSTSVGSVFSGSSR